MRYLKNFSVNPIAALISVNFLLYFIPLLLVFWLGNKVTDLNLVLLYLLGGLRLDWVLIDGEVWRMVTSMFLHVDLLHIGANMFVFWQLGNLILNSYSKSTLIVVYFFSGLGGAALSLIFAGNFATVGASGAIWGLVGLLLAATLRRDGYAPDMAFGPMDVAPLVVYSILIGMIPGFAVNNWAHLGGFMVGFVAGWILSHKVATTEKERRVVHVLMLFSVGTIILSFVAMIVSVIVQLAL